MFAKLQIHLKEISQNYECVHFPKHNYVLTFIWSHLAGYNTHPQWKILKLKSSRGEDIYVCIETHPNFRLPGDSSKLSFDLQKHAVLSHTKINIQILVTVRQLPWCQCVSNVLLIVLHKCILIQYTLGYPLCHSMKMSNPQNYHKPSF